MKTPSALDRRQFIKLGSLAAGAAALAPAAASAQVPQQTLPELPYAYDALEPHIDARTMEIHHSKHHATYISNMNKAIEEANVALPKTLEGLLAELPEDETYLRNTLRNNAGGHWNHDFFWKILAPQAKSGAASPELAAAIAEEFGSLDAFQTEFGAAATSRFGSGWAWLIVDSRGKLKVTSTANQDNPLMIGVVPPADLGTPLLGLDVWEHAYYLNYQNRRADYIKSWWNVVNWAEVSKRFAAARK
jgi:superoxide dismutase, Fe-Mn family